MTRSRVRLMEAFDMPNLSAYTGAEQSPCRCGATGLDCLVWLHSAASKLCKAP